MCAARAGAGLGQALAEPPRARGQPTPALLFPGCPGVEVGGSPGWPWRTQCASVGAPLLLASSPHLGEEMALVLGSSWHHAFVGFWFCLFVSFEGVWGVGQAGGTEGLGVLRGMWPKPRGLLWGRPAGGCAQWRSPDAGGCWSAF